MKILKEKCKCKGWKDNLPILDTAMSFYHIKTDGMKGLNKSFKFCPYCGKEISKSKKGINK